MKKKQLLLFLMILFPFIANAHDIEVKNADGVTIYYNYINEATELEVTFRGTSYSTFTNEYRGDVVIPDEVTYMNRIRKVTSIEDRAFEDCSSLTSVIIGNNVKNIGYSAFQNCQSITTIVFGNSVQNIGISAFYGCYGIKKVIVPDIAAWCSIKFADNSSNPLAYSSSLYSNENEEITDLVIPNSVTIIENNAFYYCTGLKSVTISDGVISIGENTFRNCTGLTSVCIPSSVTSIGKGAFYWCTGLTSIILPNSLTKIEESVFRECSSLSSVIIPNSVTSIGDYAFMDCSAIPSICIPNTVTSIGCSSFMGCKTLNTVTIPSSVTSIGEGAFSACDGMTSVILPNSIMEIATNLFSLCTNLIYVDIPNSVNNIGESAFYGCSDLTSITIPSSVTKIGGMAFEGVDLTTVVSQIEEPFQIEGKTKLNRTFSKNTFYNSTLYVPTGTKEKYKSAEGWKDFTFIEEGTGNGGTIPNQKQCSTPTISYQNGKLAFNCDTNGATCHYSISDTDIKAGSGNDVQLSLTYIISVFATKEGWQNSETATATLCWIDKEPDVDVINDIASMPVKGVIVQKQNSLITIQGVNDGTKIDLYGINGNHEGSVISQDGKAVISTSLPSGTAAILKIGDRSVKIIAK